MNVNNTGQEVYSTEYVLSCRYFALLISEADERSIFYGLHPVLICHMLQEQYPMILGALECVLKASEANVNAAHAIEEYKEHAHCKEYTSKMGKYLVDSAQQLEELAYSIACCGAHKLYPEA